MNKLFKKIVGVALGLTMAIGVGVAVGSSKEATPVHAADTKVSMTTGSNTVAIKVNWNSAGAPTSNNGVRMGTSSNAGSATFSIPSGTTKFGFYAVGWNGKSTTASVSASVGTIATSTASLTSNSAASGTINANATVAITETEGNAKKEFTISGVTAASTITLTTSGSNKRLIAWDAYYVTADKTLSSISVSTAPTKTSYLEGEYFSPSGLVIKRTYIDSTSDTYAYAGHTSEFTFTGKTYEWDASCSNFDDEAWSDACDALMSITDYSNYKLNRAVANISGNEIEVFLAKYDAIIGKFGTTHDHLDRFAQGGINYGVRSGVSPLVNIISASTNTVAIIVIISMVSVTAIGGYFFYRKRKEQ